MNLVMTGGAVPRLDRSMTEFGLRHLFTELGMALEAELFHGIIQQRRIVGGMGPMTVGTASLVNRRMFGFGLFYFLEQLRACFLVTFPAQDIL